MRCIFVALAAAVTLTGDKSLREDSKTTKDESWDDLARDVKGISDRAAASLVDLDTPVGPSSFIEESAKPQSFASVQSRLAELQHQSQQNIANLDQVMAMPMPPSSFIEIDQEGTSKLSKEAMDSKVNEWVQQLQAMGEEKFEVPEATTIDFGSLEKKIHALEVLTGKDASSLVQTSNKVGIATDLDRPTIAEIGEKIDALGTQIHGEPLSFVQISATSESPGLVQLEAKLKALNEKMEVKKAHMDEEAAALRGASAPLSSSFAQMTAGNLLEQAQSSENVKKFNAETDQKFSELRQRLHAISKASQAEIAAIPSSFAETEGGTLSWEDNAKAVAAENADLQEFTARTNAQLAAMRDGHHSVASALQIGAANDAGAAVEAAADAAGQ